jgi:hypothetical protein
MPAQKQLLSHDQIFGLKQTNNLAEVVKWVDDNSFTATFRTAQTSGQQPAHRRISGESASYRFDLRICMKINDTLAKQTTRHIPSLTGR